MSLWRICAAGSNASGSGELETHWLRAAVLLSSLSH
jgi:hypothetical protein